MGVFGFFKIVQMVPIRITHHICAQSFDSKYKKRTATFKAVLSSLL